MMNADARREAPFGAYAWVSSFASQPSQANVANAGPEKRSNTADALSKLPSENGITLIELVLASSLMGLLFFSGLQLLSTIFSVQSAMIRRDDESDWSRVRLEAFLRNKLQSATDVEIRDNGHSVQTSQFQIRFQKSRACGGFLLLIREGGQTSHALFRWKNAYSSPGFAWNPHAPHLLDIFLGEPTISIWLRNDI